jgi:GNAT superfamily N-acetyltransferase
MTTEKTFGAFTLTDDAAHFDVARAHDWICGQSYWADGIPLAIFSKAVSQSLVVGAYHAEGGMTAMARVVTDRATFGLICDVFVDSGWRGHGLGKALVGYLRAHPELQGFRRLMLATRDAHGLYAQFGFTPLAVVDRWMEVRDAEVYHRALSQAS